MGISDLGGAVTWGEALTLIQEAAIDPSTLLGAELAGWAYPASTPVLISLIAQIGNPKASKPLMPWALDNPRRKKSDATAEEIEAATAELESGIVFAT